MLGPDDVLPGVADVVTEVHVEAVFDDGSRLAVVSDPIGAAAARATERARRGAARARPHAEPEPGRAADRAQHRDRARSASPRTSTSSRPTRGSTSTARAAYGMRLCVPAGSSVRFDPGGERRGRPACPIGGDRIAIGFAGLVDGPLDAPGAKDEALRGPPPAATWERRNSA